MIEEPEIWKSEKEMPRHGPRRIPCSTRRANTWSGPATTYETRKLKLESFLLWEKEYIYSWFQSRLVRMGFGLFCNTL